MGEEDDTRDDNKNDCSSINDLTLAIAVGMLSSKVHLWNVLDSHDGVELLDNLVGELFHRWCSEEEVGSKQNSQKE